MSVANVNLDKAVAVAMEFGVSRLIVFGSYVTNPDSAKDLDLAVSGLNDWTFFELAARLEETLRVPLDLISLDQDSPLTRQAEIYGKVLYAA